MRFSIGSTVIVTFWGLLNILVFHWKKLGPFFKCGHMVYYLGSLSGVIFVCTGYLHSSASFGIFYFWDLIGMSLLCIRFDLVNYHFGHFSCFWVQLLKFYLVGFYYGLLYRFVCLGFSGCTFYIGTLVGCAWVNGRFNWYEFLILFFLPVKLLEFLWV